MTLPTTLSPRQLEILQLLVVGLSSREIGARLGVSKGTVDGAKSMVFNKLGANTVAEAIGVARRQGLV
jgi:DNA-binding CsgD family transcriptional regulator